MNKMTIIGYRSLKNPILEAEIQFYKIISFYLQSKRKPEPEFDPELLKAFR